MITILINLIFPDNNTFKLSDTLKSKLKDTVDMPISQDRTNDKSPTPSLKNSPKVLKKLLVSPLDDRSLKESNHENESPSKYLKNFL